MISIVSQAGKRDKQLSARQRFLNTVNEFLRVNGVQTDTGLYVDNDMCFVANCSSQSYTRAFALLLLLTSFDSESSCYCSLVLGQKEDKNRIKIEVNNYEKAEEWIFQNMHMEVQAKDRGKKAGEKYKF